MEMSEECAASTLLIYIEAKVSNKLWLSETAQYIPLQENHRFEGNPVNKSISSFCATQVCTYYIKAKRFPCLFRFVGIEASSVLTVCPRNVINPHH